MSNIFSIERLLSIYTDYGYLLLEGLYVTGFVFGLGLIFAAMLSVVVAFAKLSGNWAVRMAAGVYVTFFRGTPLLVQLFLIYFGLAQFDLFRESFLWVAFSNPLFCAVLALALNEAAYMGEVLRGGLLAIPKGEVEAADVYGFSFVARARRILLPQAIRIAWGPLSNEVIYLLKSSALVSTITVLDLMGQARIISLKTFAPLETYVLAGAMYYLVAKLLSWSFKLGERKLSY
ncbi:ABC transporter permease [Candidatus Halocynthiibacter alkanivorans]|uniref:ABC transporter permease n=1 Tax=Candidatus Halocynthiibacter alkanivorans TaxID=2267619 RepID=UPI000DF468E2|nr:ABC transporter permease subunit [Candidatus Halocynthiibacter alkanivorans]